MTEDRVREQDARMLVYDAHTHILPPGMIEAREGLVAADRWFGMLYASPRARLASATDLVASMDSAGIRGAVAFGFAFASSELCRRCNDYVLESAARYPGRIIPFAVVNPMDSDAALAETDRCLHAGAAGVGELLPDGQSIQEDSPEFSVLAALLAAHNAPLMLHVNEMVGHQYAGKGQFGPEAAYALAGAHPELRLILSHWGGGLPFYELMPSARPALSHVWYDTSASTLLYDDTVFSEVSRWAPAKLLFATDYPLLDQRRFLRRVQTLGIPEERMTALLSGNLRELLGPRFVAAAE